MRGGGGLKRNYRIIISVRAPSDPGVSKSNLNRSKRSKTSSARPSSKLTSINDLPDVILVEILSRLPRESAFQCIGVSWSWFALISSPYFANRFQSFQQRLLIFADVKHSSYFGANGEKTFFSVKELHQMKKSTGRRSFSLTFLPCWRPKRDEPLVVGTYKDLVCCCATWFYQHQYYICNPYTKQWVALPLTPRRFTEVRVGFICSPCPIKHYRYKVVRIIPIYKYSPFQFTLEIFSSETGAWAESRVLSPRSFRLDELAHDAGVAHNGMLYWWGRDFIFELNPYSNDNTTSSTTNTDDRDEYCCRFIDKPTDEGFGGKFNFLGVRRGCLQVCQLFYSDDDQYGVSIWEIMADDQVHDKYYWRLVDRVFLDQIITKIPLIAEWEKSAKCKTTIMVQGFDPNNEDILYLEFSEHLVMCNTRTKTFNEVSALKYRSIVCDGKRVFPFVIPLWPTQVPGLIH